MGWFTSELDHRDSRRFGVPLGDAAGQQIWEALALLVALRLWRRIWMGRRPFLEVKSDNVVGSDVVRDASSGLNLVAREFALDVSLGSYQPDLVTHAPGVAAVIADALSRRFQQDSASSLPVLLVDVPEFYPPTRSDEYFLTLRKPQGALHSGESGSLSK